MATSQQLGAWMTQPLAVIFGELGISQYHDAFLDQGFDSWETILDITESDLDVLGVKLGHRRKLQRRIANSRGVAPEASLVSPTQPSVDDPRLDAPRPGGAKIESREITAGGIAKRKYRRHPKSDENAPQRPPSAYVLFSNKMRDDLRGRNLTFTEIAKLVGENWQNLSQEDKKSFESQAQAAKDKYNSDLAEYKKTANYRKYAQYLHEFKAKHAHQSHDKEGAKRIKLAEVGGGNQNGTAASATGNRASRSRSGSGSEGQPGSEQPLGQHMRFESTASATNPRPVTTPASYYASVDESAHSPSSLGPDRSSQERSPVVNASPRDLSSIVHRGSGWLEDSRSDQAGMQRQLPPLSGVFDQRSGPSSAAPSSEVNGFPFPRTRGVGSPGPPPGLFGGEHRPKTLSKEQSWTDSSSSGSSYGYPRTPIEGPLVIHSLLSAKPDQQHEPMPLFYGNPTPPDHTAPFLEQGVSSNPMPHAHGAVQRTTFNTGPPPPMVPQLPPPQRPSADGYSAQFRPQHGAKPEPNLDGMSALLRAGEIVDRRTR